MDKDIVDFILGTHDLLILYDKNGKPAFKMDRSKTNTDSQMISEVFLADDYNKDVDWNRYWRNYFGEYVDPDKKSKSMGGKKLYVMLMTGEVIGLLEKNIKNVDEVLGFLAILSGYMEFHSGKLIDKRQRLKKKQLPLQYNDLLDICKYSRTKLDKMLRITKEHNLIYYEKSTKDNKGGYFISSNIIKKGKKGVVE